MPLESPCSQETLARLLQSPSGNTLVEDNASRAPGLMISQHLGRNHRPDGATYQRAGTIPAKCQEETTSEHAPITGPIDRGAVPEDLVLVRAPTSGP
jgi:hypothetical protein